MCQETPWKCLFLSLPHAWISDQCKPDFFFTDGEYYHLQPHLATPKMGNLGAIYTSSFCLHLHLMGMKILGASDFTLAITIIIEAFYSPLQRDALSLRIPLAVQGSISSSSSFRTWATLAEINSFTLKSSFTRWRALREGHRFFEIKGLG